MEEADPSRPWWRLRAIEALVAAGTGVLAIAYAWLIPSPTRSHIDHLVFLRTLARMRGGEGYYPAFRDAMTATGITVGRARAFRTPLVFEILRWVPPSMLHATFYVVVVMGTALVVLRLSSEPLAALSVALYVLVVGQAPIGRGSLAEWMLVELWTVPLLAGALLAHRKRKWWLAAGLILVAALFREVNAPLLLGGLFYAYRRRLPLRPWMSCFAVFVAGFGLHLVVAGNYVLPHGTDAALLGTGRFPTSIVDMLDWPITPALLAVALWCIAWWRVAKLGILELVAPLLAIPLLGIFVERPYWGFVVMPFAVMWTTEVACGAIRRFVASRASGGAGSSRPARTPVRAPRSPVAAPAPPSARS